IVDRLVGDAAVPDTIAPVVSQAMAAIAAWPCPIASDPRTQLLVAALILEQRPSLRATSALASVRSAAPAAASAGAVSVAAREPGAVAHAAVAPSRIAAASTVAEPAAPAVAAPLAGQAAPAARAVLEPSPSPSPSQPVPRPAGSRTRFAGLLFLLEPLRRLELPAAILDEPALATEPGLPAVLYGSVCRLLPDAWADPSALVLTDEGVPQAPPTAATPDRLAAIERAAARIAAAAARLPATSHDADLADADRHAAALPIVLPPWLDRFCCGAAAQLAAHLRACLDSDAPLAALSHKVAARPGTILVTRTHIDVTLDLADVDLDVRRAALDVNPGWVPFLGRIISFHYL
ncbi:MAG TPA: hypothetical protein VFD36_22430, partial [Kofleriaceae bacterium]|nr:hypothetical protein [Kofleriaceae bacterium]